MLGSKKSIWQRRFGGPMTQAPEKQNIWAIGDVQGCYESLLAILDKINFSPKIDGLWMVGDMVNRGPKSLEVLDFCHEHAQAVDVVLGNHELHLLACWNGIRQPNPKDSLSELLHEEQQKRFEPWLRQQPFYREYENHFLVHAGLSPQSSLSDFKAMLHQAHLQLRDGDLNSTLSELFQGESPLAQSVGCATRVRMVNEMGVPDHGYKGSPQDAPTGLQPWFTHESIDWPENKKIIFGHWAALGLFQNNQVVGLDSGCVWRRSLSAYNVKTGQVVQVNRVSQ